MPLKTLKMKIKILSVLILVFTLGVSFSTSAQEEGGDFWNENDGKTPSETPKQENKPKGATATVKPVSNSCSNRNELREEVRLLIRPYRYNLAKTSTISYKRYPQKMKVLVPIYNDQEHRIIFSTRGLPQDILITVYDKASTEKKRKALFTSTPGEVISTFELPADYKESYLFVEYAIPASEAEDRSTTVRGCVVMMMGYLFLPPGDAEETITSE